MPKRIKTSIKIKATPRILVYGEGKRPDIDEPDEIIEGRERILNESEYEQLKKKHIGGHNGFNRRSLRISYLKYDR